MRTRWARHATDMVEMGNVYKIIVQKPHGRRQLGRYWYRRKDQVKWMFEKQGMKVWTISTNLNGFYEYKNRSSTSIKGWPNKCPSPSQDGLCSTELGQGGMLTSRCECYQWYSILTAHIFWGVFLWKQLYKIRYPVLWFFFVK